MAQRFSGHARQPNEFYASPAWVTRALLPHLPAGTLSVWEPACGECDMAKVIAAEGHGVLASDIRWPEGATIEAGFAEDQRFVDGFGAVCKGDFLREGEWLARPDIDAVITNPPYGIQGKMAERFIRRALIVTRPRRGLVAMLLKPDFDSGSTRPEFFRDCPAWSKKIVLLRRIVWFEPVPDANGRLNGPSENHCWYLWSWRHTGPATIAYADGKEGETGT